jgi:hypothetical protein
MYVDGLCICGKQDNITQLWKFKHTSFLTLTTENPIYTVSDPKIISSHYGIQVEFSKLYKEYTFNIHS